MSRIGREMRRPRREGVVTGVGREAGTPRQRRRQLPVVPEEDGVEPGTAAAATQRRKTQRRGQRARVQRQRAGLGAVQAGRGGGEGRRGPFGRDGSVALARKPTYEAMHLVPSRLS